MADTTSATDPANFTFSRRWAKMTNFDLNPGLPIDARLGSSSVGTQLLFSHGQHRGKVVPDGYWVDPNL
jgi:hypothetical protein